MAKAGMTPLLCVLRLEGKRHAGKTSRVHMTCLQQVSRAHGATWSPSPTNFDLSRMWPRYTHCYARVRMLSCTRCVHVCTCTLAYFILKVRGCIACGAVREMVHETVIQVGSMVFRRMHVWLCTRADAFILSQMISETNL